MDKDYRVYMQSPVFPRAEKESEPERPKRDYHLNDTFALDEYSEARDYAVANGYTIKDLGDKTYQIVEIPAMTDEEAARLVRSERDRRIADLRWKVERHADEKAMGVKTTLTDEEYRSLLLDIQYLRDIPSLPGFPWGGTDVPWERPKEVKA